MRKFLVGLILLFALSRAIEAELYLPHIFSDNMVLQQKQDIPVWGKADPGEKVIVKLSGQQIITYADEFGDWQVRLLPMEAGGPFEMTLQATEVAKFVNVMIGEVWLCSGQSNMEMGISLVENGKQAIAEANNTAIRLFHIRQKTSGYPIFDVNTAGGWKVCSPESLDNGAEWGGFSAIAYFFAQEIQKELKVPIGVIDSSWGGTRIEPWIPVEGFALVPSLDNVIKLIDEADITYQKNVGAWFDKIECWTKSVQKVNLIKPKQPLPLEPEWPVHPLNYYAQPTSIYNAMIYPLVPYGIRGVLWYQGEENIDDGSCYYEKMRALIDGWRKIWSQGEFPFYFVQLAPYDYTITRAKNHSLPKIWEAQTAALKLPNTGMVVTLDLIYNLQDIHPINKLDVSKRLALLALSKTYGKIDVVYSGPIYKDMKIEGDKIRIYFDHTGSGLVSRNNEPLSWFEIAGQDNEFVKAEAIIDAETVVVSNPQISSPKNVRFAWYQLAQPNLTNKEGLPAAAFRTSK